jgi:hypothetical protein
VGSVRLQLAVPKEVILQLDRAQDRRSLSLEEQELHKELKFKCLGLASPKRTIARQQSRIAFLREGDVNTNFFHLQACHRGRKKIIEQLNHQGTWVTEEDVKAKVIWEHFSAILGSAEVRSHMLDFQWLGMVSEDLSSLDICFSEEEIWSVVRALPADKALGPDGFNGLFYQTAWPTIKKDIFQAFCSFWALDSRSFFLLNQAYIWCSCTERRTPRTSQTFGL